MPESRSQGKHGSGESSASIDSGAVEPTHAPHTARRLSLTRKQWIGLPLLAAIPIATLFGVFGERQGEQHTASRAVAMSVRYPTRFRYRQVQSLQISVENISGRVIDTVKVMIDTAYVTRFSSVRIDPAPYAAYAVALTQVHPGESRLISAELWGEEYGWHKGRITAVARSDTAALTLRTFVFP